MALIDTASPRRLCLDGYLEQPRIPSENDLSRQPSTRYRVLSSPQSQQPDFHPGPTCKENVDHCSPRSGPRSPWRSPHNSSRSRSRSLSYSTGAHRMSMINRQPLPPPPPPPVMHRSHQRRRSSIPGPDTIDRLDNGVFGGNYHHEGPYDPTLLARQNGPAPPVEALRESNAAAIAATPRANIIDCLEKHRPLQGTAMVAPGMRLPGGEFIGGYEEYDIMRQGGGNYKRYPQFEYLDEDLKGKGEPGYTQDLFEKQEKAARRKRSRSEGNGRWSTPNGVARVRSNSASFLPLVAAPAFPAEGNLGRSKSSASRTSPGKRLSLASRLKKHFSWGSKKD